MIELLFSFLVGLWAGSDPKRRCSAGAALALAMALLIWTGFFIHLAGLPHVVLTVLAAVTGLGAAGVMCTREKRKTLHPRWPTGILVLPALVVFGIAALVLQYRALATPVMNYDVLSYHIPLARGFLDGEGRFLLLHPDTFYARLPLGASILEAPLVSSFWSNGFGAGLNLLAILATLGGALSAMRVAAWLGAQLTMRWFAFFVYTLHPMFIGAATNALFDPLLALMAVTSLEFLLASFSRSGTLRHAILAGVLAGSAFALKFNAVGVAIIPLFFVAMVIGVRRRDWRRPALFAFGLVLAMAPWLIRSMIVGGHPLHPFRGFTETWTAEQAAFVVAVHLPQTPFTASYWLDFSRKAGAFGFPGTMLPFIAALLILALGWRDRGLRLLWPISAAVIVGYCSWLTVRNSPARFLAPSVALSIPLLVAAADIVARRLGRRTVFHGAMFLLLAVYTLPPLWQGRGVAGSLRGEERIALMDSISADLQMAHLLRVDPPEGRMLLLFEARPPLFPGNPVYNTVWDQPPWAPLLKEATDAADFSRRLRAENITTVFVNEAEFGRLLDFYATEAIPFDGPHRGLASVSPAVSDEQALAWLAAYPPSRFAGLSGRDLTVLLDFLRSQRRYASSPLRAGPNAEIWHATIRE